MDILLVDPYFLEGDSPPNWPLGQIYSRLSKDGFNVRVEDFCIPEVEFSTLDDFRHEEEAFIHKISARASESDLVYITTSLVVPQKPMPIMHRVNKILAALSESNRKPVIFIGGAQINYLQVHGLNPFSLLDNPLLVSGFIPQREELFCIVANYYLNGKDISNFPGVIFQENFNPVFSQIIDEFNLNTPTYTDWSAWNLTFYPDYRAIITSLGCKYNCSFCFESRQQFKSFSFSEVLDSYIKNNILLLAIEDSTIFGAHGIQAILKQCKNFPSTLEYSAYALISEVCNMSNEELSFLNSCGLKSLILGIETPDVETLKLYKKNILVSNVKLALSKLRAANIVAQGCVMLGIPEVCLDATLYTIDYFLDLELDIRRWHIFQPDFTNIPKSIAVTEPLSINRFSLSEFNVPDNLIPAILESASLEVFLEEHFLVRALPFLTEAPSQLHNISYSAGYSLYDLYNILLKRLPQTKESFNEEHYYRGLTPSHIRGKRVIDYK